MEEKKKIVLKFLDESSMNETIKKAVENLIAMIEKETPEEEPKPEVKEELPDIDFFIERIANKQGWKVEKAMGFLSKMYDMYPILPINLILKEIAIWMDAKYPGHIKNSPEIWSISVLNGGVLPVNKAGIKNYNTFAAFRNPKDALDAIRILEYFFKDLYGE